MSRVVIRMDPHKRSATIEAIDEREKILTRGRFGTDTDGYQQMLAAGRPYTDRVWAVEGCYGIGRHIAQRLIADGEPVLDVPPKLSSRVRVFDTGQGRKTDPVDAHSVAVAGCAAAVCAPSPRMTSPLWCACWSIAGISSAAPVPRSSPDCTTCCSSWCPAAPRKTCPPSRPGHC